MKYLFVIIITLTLLTSCSTDDPITESTLPELVLIQSYPIDVAEPSGLTYDQNSNCLWTVSDNNCMVYNLDLSGNVIAELPYIGNDLEGITFDPTTNTLWLAEESESEIVNINMSGEELARYQLPIQQGTNSGLEGICLNNLGNLSLIKEKNPGKFLALDSNYNVINDIELTFAGDYSAIVYDISRNAYWIVSDQNEKMYLWTSESGVTQEFSLPFSKPEGICILPDQDIFYFVSDSENKLYKMEIQ